VSLAAKLLATLSLPLIRSVHGCYGGCSQIFEELSGNFYFNWGQNFCDYRNFSFSDEFNQANNHSNHQNIVFNTFIDEGK